MRERDGQGGEREGGGKAKNALLVNPVASHAHTLVHMQRPKIVISWDITRRPTPSHRTCFIPGAAINHAMFNKLQRVGLRNNTHIRREFTRARECCRRYLRFFFFFIIRPALFYSFRFLIIVYRSHACAAYCVLVGGGVGGG